MYATQTDYPPSVQLMPRCQIPRPKKAWATLITVTTNRSHSDAFAHTVPGGASGPGKLRPSFCQEVRPAAAGTYGKGFEKEFRREEGGKGTSGGAEVRSSH